MKRNQDPNSGRLARQIARALKTKTMPAAEMRHGKASRMLLGAFVVVVLGFFGVMLTGTSASADTTEASEANQCLTSGSASNNEVKMEACAYDEAAQVVDVSLTDRTTASGMIQLSYFNPNATGWSLARAKKCKLIYVSINWSAAKIKRVVKNNKRKVNGTWCVRLKHGSTWANSGKDGNRVVPVTSTVRGSFSLMTLKYPAKGIWGHKGEYRGGVFIVVCDNEWLIGVKPNLNDTQVLWVRSEADVVYRNKVVLTSSGAVKVEGSLNCPAGTLYGRAEAGASASTSLWIYVRASSSATARIEAARRARANTSAWAQLRVNAQLSQEVTAHASIHLKCADAPDNPPSMQCQGPQHIYVGDDSMFADFDLTDPDGNPVSFDEPIVTGPLDVVLVEDSTVAGGKRRTVGIRAQQIPEGTSQNATLKVKGWANGKSASCTVNIMVVNEDTGW